MLNFMNREKINKMLYRLNNNKVRKWRDKSKYHANKANYYLNRARIGDEALEYMKMRAEELDIKLD